MQIEEEKGLVVFDRLISASRDFGSKEKLTDKSACATPAEKAIATNAKGAFAQLDIQEINALAIESAANLKKVLVNN